MGSVPRGIGLLSSAFGLLVARKTHATLFGRLVRLTEGLPGSFDELQRQLAHVFQVGVFKRARVTPERPESRLKPGHLVVADTRRLRYDRARLACEREVTEALSELKAAGARALPLVPAELWGEPERRWAEAWAELAKRPVEQTACNKQRQELLSGLGGAYVKAADLNFLVTAVDVPDLQL